MHCGGTIYGAWRGRMKRPRMWTHIGEGLKIGVEGCENSAMIENDSPLASGDLLVKHSKSNVALQSTRCRLRIARKDPS